MPALLTSLVALPRWAHAVIGVALLAAAFLVWDYFDDRAAIREHERAIAEQVQRKDAAADEAARKAAADAKADVDAENARAREAARGSDDPWRDGLEQLP